MCGRFGVTKAPWEALLRIGARHSGDELFEPRYNIAPTQRILVVTNEPEREARAMRWGLIPPWVANPATMKLSTFNARIETIATAPTYRSALKTKRGAIPASGFFEWRKNADGTKTPFWIRLKSDEVFFFAALWERWRDRDTDGMIESATVITQPPNAFMAPIHSRMPAVLHAAAIDEWLAPATVSPDAIALLTPTNADLWIAHAVAPSVGNVRSQGASLIDALAI